MYRVVVIVLLMIFAGLQYRLWVGQGSLAQVHHLQTLRDQLQQSNAKAQARNDAMQAQIRDLKAGMSATEDRARSEMGMIKPGETFFMTVPDSSAASSARSRGAG